MVSGIYKRGNPAQSSSASTTPSILSSATATGSLSLNWKFPLRGDSLPFSKSAKHHIIHADTKNGIDQLANYLRNESELNSGKLVRDNVPKTNHVPVMHQSLVTDNHQGLRAMLPAGKRLMGVSNRSWHSLAQLGGDSRAKHKYTTSISGSKEKETGFLVFRSVDSGVSSDQFSLSSLGRQSSGGHGYHGPHVAEILESNDSVLLSAQTPPSMLTDSPTFVDGFDGGVSQSKDETEIPDANTIIDMYTDDSVESKASSIGSLHDSAYDSCGSIGNKEESHSCEDPIDTENDVSKSPAEDTSRSLLTIDADSDADAISAMLHCLPKTPSAELFNKSSESNYAQSIRGGNSSGAQLSQSGQLQARSRVSMQQELRQKLVRCLQDDYANCIQTQEIKSSGMLREAEERFNMLLAEKEKQFEQRLADQELVHKREMEKQRSEAATQIDKLRTEVGNLTAERDELHVMLEDFVVTSTKLLDHKEAESKGLSRELGRLAFENQQLQKKVEEIEVHAQDMSKEHSEAQERVDLLVAENMRLESISSALTSDVAVAEERNSRIKLHAEETLQKANMEIERLRQKAACLQQESSAQRIKYTKADTRMKSLQIQLQSAKKQNDELLCLCERLGASTSIS
ncbi:hypothetical protein H4R99_003196 [Coemansia sp. RSA 1722]|nr:Transforming acidic coiled-coil-containing protein 3 [Coemansia sp. RSA 485]KAJ2600799.1 hypothetical protein H4R99_003196 [Coemansia sp. RSA 1722]